MLGSLLLGSWQGGNGVSPRLNAAVLTERWLVGLPSYFWSAPCAGAVGTPLAPTDVPLHVRSRCLLRIDDFVVAPR